MELMNHRLLRIITATACAPALALLAACGHLIIGNASYAPETPSAHMPLVKSAELQSLILKPTEVGTIMNATQLDITAVYTTVGAVPQDAVSDPKCAGALIAGAEPMYRGSGYRAVQGLGMKGEQDRLVDQGAGAFGDADEAHRFIDTAVTQWTACVDKLLTVTAPGAAPVNWIAHGPTTSYGAHVLLRMQEGGHGYACSHAMTDRSNVVADVLACSYEEDRLNDQAATIANAMLAKMPQ